MAGADDVVKAALKMIAGGVKKSRSDAPISAWHATEKPFASYDWSLLGSTTKPNVEGTSAENWAMDLARVGPWSSEKKIDLGFGTHIPVTVGGKGKAFNSLDDLQRAIAKAGGPDKFRQNMTAKGFGHLRVADEEFGGTSYVSLTPETFTVRDDPIERASGGSIREGYGPGGWVDDVVKMAGKVISGEGDDAAESALRAFAETKLKTPKGKPMRLYHLTPGNFSEFSVSPENRSGPVVFLSPYADFQPAYHQAAERGPNDEITSIFKEGANVMPVYADVRNPLILDSYEKIKEAQTKYQSGDRGFPYFVKPEAKAAMEADGYDGIIFGGNDPAPYRSETSTEGWNPHIGFQRNREEEIIVFDPKKVKSAISNTGKYDFTDPDITKAGGGSTSKPQRSMGGNNSISGALNVARGLNGGK